MMMTAHGSVEAAVEAMKLGAFDYLPKPLTRGAVPRAAGDRTADMAGETAYAGYPAKTRARLDVIVGRSARPCRKLQAIGPGCAQAAEHVLILGESGTGKELVARALH